MIDNATGRMLTLALLSLSSGSLLLHDPIQDVADFSGNYAASQAAFAMRVCIHAKCERRHHRGLAKRGQRIGDALQPGAVRGEFEAQ